jgi:hypothetical protein
MTWEQGTLMACRDGWHGSFLIGIWMAGSIDKFVSVKFESD